MIHEQHAMTQEGDGLELDPFAFWPDLRSRLVGLGGPEPGNDPDYTFHTLYVACGTGPIAFTVSMGSLRAERGTLILRVHELPEVMGASARQIAISQTQLIELIRGGGKTSLPAEARAGHSYAILGHIYGDTVATAETLQVEVARRALEIDNPATLTRFRSGTGRVGKAGALIGEHEGRLAAPMSQLCTAAQFDEPVYAQLASHFARSDDGRSIATWERVYIARVLDRYDASRPGARGLGIGGLGDELADGIAAAGPALTLTAPTVLEADVPMPPGAMFKHLDPHAIEDLAGFDFAYATRAGGVGGGDRQMLLRFIEDVLRTLKPGGLLTLVVPIDVTPRPIGAEAGAVIRRSDLDRTALLLVSRGHQVAQLLPFGKAVATEEEQAGVLLSAFGLVVRKAS